MPEAFPQLTYTYQARKPGVKEPIVDMAFNGAGVRDTATTLKNRYQQGYPHFKKLASKRIVPASKEWLAKLSASHALLRCRKKSSVPSLINTGSTN